MIIGLTGPNAAGKTSVADILIERGFKYYSLSDVLRDEAKRRKLKPTRDVLREIGNKLRKRYSAKYLARKINERIQEDKKKGIENFVVDSIRNVKEVNELRKNPDFILLGVNAPIEKRFLRAKERNRLEDISTFEEFKEKEELEKNSDPTKQQLDKVLDMADKYVYNDGTFDELKQRLDFALKHERKRRPDWDTYFMKICDIVKTRSVCLRREVGAVLVKNNQIISTGYNGPPKGHPHCDSLGGCIRDQLKIPSGQRHELSRAAHAEQNAIAQAAANGISTKDSVMYCTTMPCSICMRMIANAGIKKVIYKGDYQDTMSKEIAERSGVQLVKYKGPRYV